MNRRLIIVGAGWAGKTIASVLLKRHPEKLLGFVDDVSREDHIIVSNGNGGAPLPILGHSRDLIKIVQQNQAEGVVLAVTHNRQDHLLEQVVKCYEDGIPVFEMPELYANLTHRIPVHHIKHQWIVPKLTEPPHDYYTLFHDLTNYLLSLFGLTCFFLPLFPIIAIAIKFDSRGPIFFKQKRVGKKGRIFTLLKFRTMRKNAENGTAMWASEEDTRITRVGRILRKFRLDELPQFLNVLKGDMALIGPRPERPEFVQKLEQQIPFYHYRHLVRPGITGWAQVKYPYGNSVEDALEKLQYDLYWIKNRSFLLDLRIIFRSIKVILTGFGAV